MRRPKSLIVIFTASVLLAVGALQGLDLWWRHERALASARTRSGNLGLAVSEYVRGAFALADTTLRQLAIHGTRVGGPSAPPQAWMPILEAAQGALPGSGSLSVTDRTGTIRYSTLEPIVGQSRKSTDLFRSLAGRDTDDMAVGAPMASPLYEGRYIIPVARRLETPDGRFDGVVVSVVRPESFRTFFRTLDIGMDGVIWVFHPAGVVIFREPSLDDPLGQSAADHPIVMAAQRAPGQGVVISAIDATDRTYINAYRMLAAPDLTIAVSLSEHEILADWRTQVRTTLLGFGLFTATLVGLVLMLFRQIDALQGALGREKSARRDAEVASRLKDEFLMTLSHELRTPLNAILGWTRMLATGAVANDQRQQALATIERNAHAQTRMVEDLLDVSRAITGKLQLKPRMVNVGDTVLAAVETLRPALAAKEITFESRVDPGLAPIAADPDRLQQVVWNLLSNAIKFTPRGGLVRLEVGAAFGGVEITIRDNGSGIEPGFLPYVFDRFRQADAGIRREAGGLGLGLAIARHLVELHGGSITAESAGEGHGATFRIVLPGRPAA